MSNSLDKMLSRVSLSIWIWEDMIWTKRSNSLTAFWQTVKGDTSFFSHTAVTSRGYPMPRRSLIKHALALHNKNQPDSHDNCRSPLTCRSSRTPCTWSPAPCWWRPGTGCCAPGWSPQKGGNLKQNKNNFSKWSSIVWELQLAYHQNIYKIFWENTL